MAQFRKFFKSSANAMKNIYPKAIGGFFMGRLISSYF